MLYTDKQIKEKLQQVEEFEAKWGENTETRAWKKWCTDHLYRKNEEAFRIAMIKSLNLL